MGIRLRCGAVHREPIFIQTGIDERLTTFGVEEDTIGVEEHVGSSRLEVANHTGQVFVEQWLAQAV